MILMPSNNTSGIVHYFAGKYPNKLGLLFSPKGWRIPSYYFNYALDNGCFNEWDPYLFFNMLRQIKNYHQPLWVCVPDVVADAEATLKRWRIYSKKVNKYTNKLAFVVQDGMEPQDVPKNAYCVFVGGSTEWKLENAHKFKGVKYWLHIGRVNTKKRLNWALKIGANSIDGTGWFRSKQQKLQFIEYFENHTFSIHEKVHLLKRIKGE